MILQEIQVHINFTTRRRTIVKITICFLVLLDVLIL